MSQNATCNYLLMLLIFKLVLKIKYPPIMCSLTWKPRTANHTLWIDKLLFEYKICIQTEFAYVIHWSEYQFCIFYFFLKGSNKKQKANKDKTCSDFTKNTQRNSEEMLGHERAYAYTVRENITVNCIMVYQHICTSIRRKVESGKAPHRDPQTLNGVGVKGLVGERRRKSLLWL